MQLRWRAFEKTGCLITMDGTNDNLIMPEGSHNYTFSRNVPGTDVEQLAITPAEEPADEARTIYATHTRRHECRPG